MTSFTKTLMTENGSIKGKIKYLVEDPSMSRQQSGSCSSRDIERGAADHRVSSRSRNSSPASDFHRTDRPSRSSNTSSRPAVDARTEFPPRRGRPQISSGALSEYMAHAQAPPRMSRSRQRPVDPSPSRAGRTPAEVPASESQSSRGQGTSSSSMESILDILENMQMDESEDEDPMQYADNESFFPEPKVTFMMDKPDNVICSICMTIPLRLGRSSGRPSENDTVVLACGHVSCAGCMELWLDANDSCPFCRVSHEYKACGHPVKPRVIAKDTIMSLPKTIPEGGKIGSCCPDCRADDSARKLRRHEQAIRKWRRVVAQANTSIEDSALLARAQEALGHAKRAFEDFQASEDYQNTVRARTHW
ncbi:hypothetical protein JX266_003487 [Neoarthrinium moseri]|nr:hypothetical protein JX266_003487 [Neoarthrinium moseri]